MKRLTAITIGLLLIAATASLVFADHWDYTGNGTGNCTVESEQFYPFVPWEGDLYYDDETYDDGFDGFWGGEQQNYCRGAVYETSIGGLTAYRLDDGEWIHYGSGVGGTWDCIFVPSADTADGTWESENQGCTDGTLWGNVYP